MTSFLFRHLLVLVGLFLIARDSSAQMIGNFESDKPEHETYREAGVNAFILSRRLFNFNTVTSESTFVPLYGPGFFFKWGRGRRLLRLSLNYVRFVSAVRTDRDFFSFNGRASTPKAMFSRQELEVKVGIQRFARKQSAVQRYVAHDFSYGYGIEKIDGFPVFANLQFGTSVRQAISFSQIYGWRFTLAQNVLLNVETGFLFEVAFLDNVQNNVTHSSLKWRPLTLSVGFNL